MARKPPQSMRLASTSRKSALSSDLFAKRSVRRFSRKKTNGARDVARAFSGSRDARVQLQLLEKLRRQAHLESAAFSKTSSALEKEMASACRSLRPATTRGENDFAARSAIGSKAGRWTIWGWTIFAARYGAPTGVAGNVCAALAQNRPPKISTPCANG